MRPAPQLSSEFYKRGVSLGAECLSMISFPFPHHSLTQCSRMVHQFCWMWDRKDTEASMFRKHCIEEAQQFAILCKRLEPLTYWLWYFYLSAEGENITVWPRLQPIKTALGPQPLSLYPSWKLSWAKEKPMKYALFPKRFAWNSILGGISQKWWETH